MNKIFFLLFITYSTIALANKQVPGIVIYSNETISVTFDVPTVAFTGEWDFSRLQAKAYFYDKTGKKSFVKPTDALEIDLYTESDTIRMVSVIYKGKKGRGFARLVIESKINVYAMEISTTTTTNNPTHVYGGTTSPGSSTYRVSGHSTSGGPQYSGYLMVQKRNEGPDAKAERLYTSKAMIEFFSDCPEVVKEIEEQELTNAELPVVIDFYFQYCGED